MFIRLIYKQDYSDSALDLGPQPSDNKCWRGVVWNGMVKQLEWLRVNRSAVGLDAALLKLLVGLL